MIDGYVRDRTGQSSSTISFTNAYVFGLRVLQSELRQDDSQLEATNVGQPDTYNTLRNPQWVNQPRPPHTYLYCPRTTPPPGALCRLRFQLRDLFYFHASIPPAELHHWWTVPLAFDGLIDLLLDGAQ